MNAMYSFFLFFTYSKGLKTRHINVWFLLEAVVRFECHLLQHIRLSSPCNLQCRQTGELCRGGRGRGSCATQKEEKEGRKEKEKEEEAQKEEWEVFGQQWV